MCRGRRRGVLSVCGRARSPACVPCVACSWALTCICGDAGEAAIDYCVEVCCNRPNPILQVRLQQQPRFCPAAGPPPSRSRAQILYYWWSCPPFSPRQGPLCKKGMQHLSTASQAGARCCDTSRVSWLCAPAGVLLAASGRGLRGLCGDHSPPAPWAAPPPLAQVGHRSQPCHPSPATVTRSRL